MKKALLKEYLHVSGGVIVLIAWIFIFCTGLLVDSRFYRVAINYGFSDWNDWLWTVLSFTISNVTILAFLSGLLGGIASKTIVTEGFTLTKNELKEKDISAELFENPFISGFRGVFVFLAILSFQYLSSFTDLSSINLNEPAKKEVAKEEKRDNEIYDDILEVTNDTAIRAKIKKVIVEAELKNKKRSDFDSISSRCIEIKDSIILITENKVTLKENTPEHKAAEVKKLEQKLRLFRNQLQIPQEANIPGLTSVSYFRFAVLMSFLSFIFGYDPTLFKSFLSKLPFARDKKKSVEEGKA